MKEVILVNERDEVIGRMEKLEAHQKGLLHRAFSIFIFNAADELLLQRRAMDKYHSGGLWTNTCCSHPAPGEDIVEAAKNRLAEEMGFKTTLTAVRSFIYETNFSNGLIEHEFDHIFTGIYNGQVHINTEEAMDFKWIAYDDLSEMVATQPEDFTVWFLAIYEDVMQHQLRQAK